MGITEQHVRNLLFLMSAPFAMRELVATGKLSVTLAIKVLREHGPEVVQILQDGLKNAGEQQKDRAPKNLLASNTRPSTGHALIGSAPNTEPGEQPPLPHFFRSRGQLTPKVVRQVGPLAGGLPQARSR